MQYDMEANWELLTTCNFRCDFCYLSDKALGKKLEVAAAPDQWAAALENTNKTWLLNIVGGEPFIYPNFVDLCAELSKRHYLTIASNLSRTNAVLDFAARIDPEKVYYLYASLHWTERQRKHDVQEFIKGVKALKSLGFTVVVAQVMTHEAIAAFPEIQATFAPHDIIVFPKTARGKARDGNRYPDSYSPEELAIIQKYDELARAQYTAEPKRANAPTPSPIFNKAGKLVVSKFPWYIGRSCAAGFKFVRILANGDVIRCASWQKQGNLLDGSFRLNDGPKICYTRYCAFFCEKYTQPEFTGRSRKRKASSGEHFALSNLNATDISDI